MTEWQMALQAALHFWRGTSLTDGAQNVLRQICGPHKHVGTSAEPCSRCGKNKSQHPNL